MVSRRELVVVKERKVVVEGKEVQVEGGEPVMEERTLGQKGKGWRRMARRVQSMNQEGQRVSHILLPFSSAFRCSLPQG